MIGAVRRPMAAPATVVAREESVPEFTLWAAA
jgi:hypothetical protein